MVGPGACAAMNDDGTGDENAERRRDAAMTAACRQVQNRSKPNRIKVIQESEIWERADELALKQTFATALWNKVDSYVKSRENHIESMVDLYIQVRMNTHRVCTTVNEYLHDRKSGT